MPDEREEERVYGREGEKGKARGSVASGDGYSKMHCHAVASVRGGVDGGHEEILVDLYVTKKNYYG